MLFLLHGISRYVSRYTTCYEFYALARQNYVAITSTNVSLDLETNHSHSRSKYFSARFNYIAACEKVAALGYRDRDIYLTLFFALCLTERLKMIFECQPRSKKYR